MSQAQQMRKQIEQLRREASVQRVPISRAAGDLKKFVDDHQAGDTLVIGFLTQKDNPFKEKASCSIF